MHSSSSELQYIYSEWPAPRPTPIITAASSLLLKTRLSALKVRVPSIQDATGSAAALSSQRNGLLWSAASTPCTAQANAH